jgi:ketosteroid isomerase-like protein
MVEREALGLVERGFRFFELGKIDDMAELWHEDVRVTGPEGWPEPGPFEGREQAMAQFRRLTSEMGKNVIRDVEVVTERDGWIVLSFIWDVQGAGSGAPIASKMAVAFLIRDGRFSEGHFRWTPDEALAASGLDPST